MNRKSWYVVIILALFAAACAPAQPSTTAAPAAEGNPTAANPSAIPSVSAPSSTSPASGVSTSVAESSPTNSAGAGEITYVLVAGQSEARYRVREQLASLSLPSDAVGKTSAISGSVLVKADGSIDKAQSKFTVDLSSLTSDKGMRDNYVRQNILQTSQYPQAVFVPAQVTGLPSPLPQSGQVSFQVTGDLTIKDLTKPVTWDITGQVTNGEAVGTATTTFTFEDFNLQQPRVPVVLSVEDHITLEVDLALKPAS